MHQAGNILCKHNVLPFSIIPVNLTLSTGTFYETLEVQKLPVWHDTIYFVMKGGFVFLYKRWMIRFLKNIGVIRYQKIFCFWMQNYFTAITKCNNAYLDALDAVESHIQGCLPFENIFTRVVPSLNRTVLLWAGKVPRFGDVLTNSYEESTQTSQQSRFAIIWTWIISSIIWHHLCFIQKEAPFFCKDGVFFSLKIVSYNSEKFLFLPNTNDALG